MKAKAFIKWVISLAISRHWPVHQLDVKNTFLHGSLSETVYMHQPPGFRDPRHPDHVCLLQRSLYGLKQAPRAWFQRFTAYAARVGFHHSRCDSSLFIYRAQARLWACGPLGLVKYINFGYGVRNEEGQTILDFEFTAAHDLVVVNSFFNKRDAHLITYHSGDHDTQIDCMLVRRGDLRVCKDCKVFPGEVCLSQHRFLALDIHIKRRPRSTKMTVKPRILWKSLYGEASEVFRARVGSYPRGGR
ncbi:ribonuclease H-like domain-containing protein [Tanacetum coccineum]|uniref:Ribonuclease H-like domain-containing protein n=1 Tax=Tanacetum coccineum TaxID=301880 RepID=A0ABQ5AS47_9ASTR